MNEEQDFQGSKPDPNAGLAQDGPGDGAQPPLTPYPDITPEQEAQAEASMRNIEVMPPPTAPLPSLGRVVRYVLPQKSRNYMRDRAAIVADVEDGQDVVNLSVLKAHPQDLVDHYADDLGPIPGCIAGWDDKSAVGLIENVPYDPTERPGTWHWPKRP